jgi:D-serine deaminase-like pyridoxal phosphate-dependent protein
VLRSSELLGHLDIERPTFLVDRERVARNIQRMVERAAAADVVLRPHFKTHRSHAIGRWFREFGIDGITVSSVEMARYFSDDGWDDITLAFPFPLQQLPRVAEISEHIRLGVMVHSTSSVDVIASLRAPGLRVWIKIDTGYKRVGLDWDDDETLEAVARRASDRGLEVVGVLTHNGLVYQERSREGVLRVHRESVERIRHARDVLMAAGLDDITVSIGDTPGTSAGGTLEGVNEIRPGNFVFYDLTQAALGSCSADEIAVAVACPVVAVYPHRGHTVIQGGAVHLSLDALETGDGERIYGRVNPEWPAGAGDGAPLIRLSQEHGIVRTGGHGAQNIEVGDIACVLPVHACLASNMHDRYLTLDGEWLDTMDVGDRGHCTTLRFRGSSDER